MDFAVLYNPDNGICHPWSKELQDARADLIPITAGEIILLRKMSIGEVLDARKREKESEVRVVSEVESAGVNNHVSKEDLKKAVSKGVSVIGNIESPEEQEAEKYDALGDKIVSYSKYLGDNAPIIPVEELANVPNKDLVRFAWEALGISYDEPDEEMAEDKREEYYVALRIQIAKKVSKDTRKKKMKARGANNGGGRIAVKEGE